MDTNVFRIGEAVSFGWEKMKKNFWFFVALLLIVWMVQVIPTGIANIFKEKMILLYIMFSLAAWVIQIIVNAGLTKIVLNITDGKETRLSFLYAYANLWGKVLLSSVVYGLIVMGGILLLIVPGIIWAIKYQFFVYFIVDKNLGPLEAIRKSGEITAGKKRSLFALGLVLGLINLLGLLFLVVGLFATIPVAMVAMAYVYRKLTGEFSESKPKEDPNISPVAV